MIHPKRLAAHILAATPEDKAGRESIFLAGFACGMLCMFVMWQVFS